MVATLSDLPPKLMKGCANAEQVAISIKGVSYSVFFEGKYRKPKFLNYLCSSQFAK